jgi:hypothetical protein
MTIQVALPLRKKVGDDEMKIARQQPRLEMVNMIFEVESYLVIGCSEDRGIGPCIQL